MMKIKIYIEKTKQNKVVSLDNKSTLIDLIKKIGINPVTVIASRNDEIIFDSEEIKEDDVICFHSAISGG